MVTRARPQIRQRWPYLLFLGGLLALVAYTFSLTTQFRVPETGQLPRLVLIGMTAIIFIDLALTLFPQLIPDQLKPNSTISSDFENRSISPVNVAKQFSWIICFLGGIYYVGFFTACFGFAFLYIFVNGPEESLQRRAVISAAWAVGINIFLYVLFVELLQVGSVFNFGFLP